MKVVWTLVGICSFFGLYVLFVSIDSVDTVMQQAVVGIQGVGLAVIPYCIARALEGFQKKT